MSKKIILLIALITLVFGGLFFTKFLQINKAISTRTPPPPPLVTTVDVQHENWSNKLSTVGEVTPFNHIFISNEVAGIISAIHFKSGQAVKQGDLLLELNTSTDQAKLDGHIAERKLAQLKFKRQATLIKSKATSRSSYDEARASLDLANASVIAQKSLLDKMHIRAPFDGIIGIRLVSMGEYLDKGHKIAPLVAPSPTMTDFHLAERYIADLAIGQTVDIKVQAYPDELFHGQIQAINPGLNQGTRAVVVRALVDNPELKLKAGMFAEIDITISTPALTLTLPETAVLYNTYGSNVYLVSKDSEQATVTYRSIKIGQRRHGKIEILSGLKLGDTVVDEGHIKLRNGIPIRIAKPKSNTKP
ncbi:MAG: efflux RND transporter periplasmic adaptor subunit [Cycloclasticus sp.]|nr:efflux RND transporter periplasmic adaptor subunit [Cycloclasticus sp.]